MVNIVHTCQKYSFLWPSFHYHWNKWQNEPIMQVTNKEGQSWTEGLYNALKRIDTDYIFYIQDDMILKNRVDLQAWYELAKGARYWRVTIAPKSPYYTLDSNNCWLPESQYLISHQPAIWRKDFLMEVLEGLSESPWEHEINGTKRLRESYGDALVGRLKLLEVDWFYHICRKGKITEEGQELMKQVENQNK